MVILGAGGSTPLGCGLMYLFEFVTMPPAGVIECTLIKKKDTQCTVLLFGDLIETFPVMNGF